MVVVGVDADVDDADVDDVVCVGMESGAGAMAMAVGCLGSVV